MTAKGFIGLAAVAAVLGAAAYFSGSSRKLKTSSVNGKSVVEAFEMSEVARVEIGGPKPLVLAAGDEGWRIETLYGYPADVGKLRDNLLKLGELKVGQAAPGVKIAESVEVAVKNAGGGTLASLRLGAQHRSKPRAGMEMYGGYPDGRYVDYKGQTVLVKDTLDAFDGDPMKWCDAHLTDTPYLSFTSVVDPAKEPECGFATGSVCRVTYKGDTNALAKVGGTAPGGARFFKIDSEKWVYTIPSYSAEQLVGKPKDAAEKE